MTDQRMPATQSATQVASLSSAEPIRAHLTPGGAQGEGDISYLEWGAGKNLPPFHFAHANGFNGQTYSEILQPLAGEFHIRAWDARGHGATSLRADPTRQKGWNIYCDDLIASLEQFHAQTGQKVLLAGHSMGGTTSLFAASKRPDLVRGLLLLDPVMIPLYASRMMGLINSLPLKIKAPGLAEGAARRRAQFESREAMVAAYLGRGAFRSWPNKMLCDYVEGGTHEIEGGVELSCAPAWEAANFLGHRHNAWAALSKLKVPVSLLYAGIGSTCRPPAPEIIAKVDRRATIMRLGTCTHFLPMEKPEIVQAEMRALELRTRPKS